MVRAVARKSTAKPAVNPSAAPRVEHLDSQVGTEHKGSLKYYRNPDYVEVAFERHQCGKKCVERFPNNEGKYKGKKS